MLGSAIGMVMAGVATMNLIWAVPAAACLVARRMTADKPNEFKNNETDD